MAVDDVVDADEYLDDDDYDDDLQMESKMFPIRAIRITTSRSPSAASATFTTATSSAWKR